MKIEITGNCLHGGDSRLEIVASDRFALSVCGHCRESQNISLDIENVRVDNHLVSLGEKPQLHVVEHLFSALYGLQLFNVRIDVYGNEIPFFDGSSQEFVVSLQDMQNRIVPDILRFNKCISVRLGESFIRYEPLDEEKLIIEMELHHPHIKMQKIAIELNEDSYIHEIAPARTFVFTDEKDTRLKNLPPYGIGITKDNVYSSEPLRFSNELVRHKILDLLGDLFVLKKKLSGKIRCRNTSHYLNFLFVKKLCWIADRGSAQKKN